MPETTAIHWKNETLLTIPQAAREVGVGRGRVYGWIRDGVSGVHLEILAVGGTWHTSVEALQRFFVKLTPSHRELATPKIREFQGRRSKRRRKQLEAVDRRLAEAEI